MIFPRIPITNRILKSTGQPSYIRKQLVECTSLFLEKFMLKHRFDYQLLHDAMKGQKVLKMEYFSNNKKHRSIALKKFLGNVKI
jgi:hypothetical protein